VVELREAKGMSWAPIAFKLKLVPAHAARGTAGNAARRLYRMVAGENASTAALPRPKMDRQASRARTDRRYP
jgi:hypothetical protein